MTDAKECPGGCGSYYQGTNAERTNMFACGYGHPFVDRGVCPLSRVSSTPAKPVLKTYYRAKIYARFSAQGEMQQVYTQSHEDYETALGDIEALAVQWPDVVEVEGQVEKIYRWVRGE